MDEIKIPAVRLNRKMNFVDRGNNPVPRVTHRKGHDNKSPRFKIKCGCCDESFDIYYGDFDNPVLAGLEIVGVNASIEDWRAIFLPLLGFERQGDLWVDVQKVDIVDDTDYDDTDYSVWI